MKAVRKCCKQLGIMTMVMSLGMGIAFAYPPTGPLNGNAWFFHIDGEVFAGINNWTFAPAANGYGDYTASVAPAQVLVGNSHNITTKISTYNPGNSCIVMILIDWSQNNSFLEGNELVFNQEQPLSAGGWFSGSVAVPTNAVVGHTTMRVIAYNWSAQPRDGGTWNYQCGEAEDYRVRVSGMSHGVGAIVTNSTMATLNGNLVATNGESPTVYVYWGPVNGGTNETAWTNMISMGTPGLGAFSTNVTDVLPDTYYYYRCCASNGTLEDWSIGTSEFFMLPQGPVVSNTPATGITATSAVFNANIPWTGSETTTVTVYWGMTNAGAGGVWQYTNLIGEVVDTGPVSTNIYSLQRETVYYYMFYATNVNGEWWAEPAASFITWQRPTVVTKAATGIGRTGATLNGEITDTGDDTNTMAYFYWGPVDGSTNKSAWSNEVYVGVRTAAFSTTLTLLANQTVYYTTYATNGAGERWGTTVTNFTTLPPLLSIADAGTMIEGDSGTAPAGFAVTAAERSALDVTIGWTTTNGMAEGGSDYIVDSGSILFTAGNIISTTITVQVIGNRVYEYHRERFYVTISNVLNAVIGDNEGECAVIDNDFDLVYKNWLFKSTMFFNGYTKPSTLTNFAALLIIGSGYTADMAEDGADLRFSNAGNRQELDYEIDTWDTNGSSKVWVQVPELVTNTTKIYMHYGNTGILTNSPITSPTNVPGCVMWLSADAGVLTNAGGFVTNWLDKSGTGNSVVQTNIAAAPAYVAGALNGKPVVRFDGDASMQCASTTNFPASAWHVFVVQKKLVQKDSYLFKLSSTAPDRVSSHLPWGDGTVYWDCGGGGDARLSVGGLDTTGYDIWHLVSYDGSPNRQEIWQNGLMRARDASAVTVTDASGKLFELGVGDGTYMNADLAEFMIFGRDLTSDEQNKIGYYLEQKYGLNTAYRNPNVVGYSTDGSMWLDDYRGIWHLNGSGADSTPLNNNGIVYGPQDQSGVIGGAKNFDGFNDFIACGNNATLNPYQNLTLSFWVRPTDNTGTKTLAGSSWDCWEGGLFFVVRHIETNLQVYVGGDYIEAPYYYWPLDGATAVNALPTSELNQWMHIAFTFDNPMIRLYKNGQLVASKGSWFGQLKPQGNGQFQLGRWPNCGDAKYFNGRLDEVRLSGSTDSGDRIWASYMNQASNSMFVTYGLPAGHGMLMFIK